MAMIKTVWNHSWIFDIWDTSADLELSADLNELLDHGANGKYNLFECVHLCKIWLVEILR